MPSTAVEGKAPPSGSAVSWRGGTASLMTRVSPGAGRWSTGLVSAVTVPPPDAPAATIEIVGQLPQSGITAEVVSATEPPLVGGGDAEDLEDFGLRYVILRMDAATAGYWASLPTLVGIAGALLIPRLAVPERRFAIFLALILAAVLLFVGSGFTRFAGLGLAMIGAGLLVLVGALVLKFAIAFIGSDGTAIAEPSRAHTSKPIACKRSAWAPTPARPSSTRPWQSSSAVARNVPITSASPRGSKRSMASIISASMYSAINFCKGAVSVTESPKAASNQLRFTAISSVVVVVYTCFSSSS